MSKPDMHGELWSTALMASTARRRVTSYREILKNNNSFLCGRPIAALHVLPVGLSVCHARAHNSKTEKRRKIKIIGIHVPQDTSKWSANLQLKRSNVKVTASQKEIAAYLAYMFTYGRQRRRLRRRLQTRPKPLPYLIFCRRLARSATGRTAAYQSINQSINQI